MQVILTHDVAKLGRRHDIVTVPNGRALNMLIPQGLAIAATTKETKRLRAKRDTIAAKQSVASEQFLTAIKKLDEQVVTVTAKANAQGHLFAAVKPEAVVNALAERDIAITPTQVLLTEPIKAVGEFLVTISNGEHAATITVKVVAV